MALSRTVSQINGDICKISHPLISSPAEGVPLGILYRGWGLENKTRMMPIPEYQKMCDMFIRFDTVWHWTDRQTDRQKW